MAPLTRFDLIFHVTGSNKTLAYRNIYFDKCYSPSDVRGWINESQDFINMGNHIINKRNISHIYITKTKEA